MDDLRASGHTTERSWAVGRQLVSGLQYFGLQDAPRKRKPPVRASGPWAGAVFTTSDTEIQQSVTQTKWDKAKAQIAELTTMMSESADGLLNYKRLEQIRGFLCHLAMIDCIPLSERPTPNLGIAPSRMRQIWLEDGLKRVGCIFV
jgi:hypothetical protein